MPRKSPFMIVRGRHRLLGERPQCLGRPPDLYWPSIGTNRLLGLASTFDALRITIVAFLAKTNQVTMPKLLTIAVMRNHVMRDARRDNQTATLAPLTERLAVQLPLATATPAVVAVPRVIAVSAHACPSVG